MRTYRFDYLAVTPAVRGTAGALQIWNSTAGLYEAVEDTNYDDTTNVWSDIVLQVDTGSSQSTEADTLDVENSRDSVYKNTFVNSGAPSGTQFDFFRFSSARSSSNWALHNQGKALTRLYWDYGTNKAISTNYFDSHTLGLHIIRHHRFKDHVTTSRDVTVGLELMRPDEAPDTFSVVTRNVSITVTTLLQSAIIGPDAITSNGTYSWYDSAFGGIAPYAYGNWYYNSSPGPEQLVDSGATYQRVVTVGSNPYIFRLRNIVTDSNSSTFNAKFFVEVINDGGGSLAAVQENGVRFADGSCRLRPSEFQERQTWLEGLFDAGNTVESCVTDVSN